MMSAGIAKGDNEQAETVAEPEPAGTVTEPVMIKVDGAGQGHVRGGG